MLYSFRGFTLIEFLIGIALSATLLGLSAFFGLQSYQQVLSRFDADTILTALLHARSEAINGICSDSCPANLAYSVHLTATSALIFAGTSFVERDSTRDVVIPLSGNSTITASSDTVFHPLTGFTGATSTITVERPGSTPKTIQILPTGVIEAAV